MPDQSEVDQVKEAYKSVVFSKPNVVGVGTGYKVSKGEKTDILSVVVLVREKHTALDEQDRVPRELDGVRTDVVQVGDLRALQAPTGRFRPAPGGVSIGHFRITAGTFGVTVRDRATGERLILSNNHVLANSNDADIGDPILQPGPADGGSLQSDAIASLERFVPIEFAVGPGICDIASAYARFGNFMAELLGSAHRVETYQKNDEAVNLVDAALARPLSDDLILDEILQIGTVEGTTVPSLGMAVRKFGRTTSFTTGELNVLGATVDVNYGSGRVARFEDQIVAGAMSQGGDSGSLLVDADSQLAVGLLFAGSDTTTIFNPIHFVLNALDITI